VKKLLALDDLKQVKEFEAEIQTLTKLRPHPNLVLYLGFARDPIAIAMEYVRGGTLAHKIYSDRSVLPSEFVIAMLQGVAAGVNLIHLFILNFYLRRNVASTLRKYLA